MVEPEEQATKQRRADFTTQKGMGQATYLDLETSLLLVNYFLPLALVSAICLSGSGFFRTLRKRQACEGHYAVAGHPVCSSFRFALVVWYDVVGINSKEENKTWIV